MENFYKIQKLFKTLPDFSDLRTIDVLEISPWSIRDHQWNNFFCVVVLFCSTVLYGSNLVLCWQSSNICVQNCTAEENYYTEEIVSSKITNTPRRDLQHIYSAKVRKIWPYTPLVNYFAKGFRESDKEEKTLFCSWGIFY